MFSYKIIPEEVPSEEAPTTILESPVDVGDTEALYIQEEDQEQNQNHPSAFNKRFIYKIIPSLSTAAHFFTQIVACLLFYATIWGLFQEDAEPGGASFALMLLVVCCYIGGKIAAFLKLPALIGMLLVGFMYRNLPFIRFYKDIPQEWSFILRNSALVVILLRAGLGLDPKVLKKMSFVCARLALVPCLTEATSSGIASHFILSLPWIWSFCLGFILSALSPAVVIPSMLYLAEQGYGQEKGITTLIIAAASIDDVCAITGFGVCLGIIFSTGSLAWTLAKGPISVLMGIVYGIIVGILCWSFPRSSDDRKVFYRVVLLTFGGLGVMFMSAALNFSAAGAIGCLTLAFVTAIKWREEEDKNAPVCGIENSLWIILQTFLFGLIGAEVSVSDIKTDIGYGVAIVLIGLTFRIMAAFVCLCKSNLNAKEKIFVSFAWLPKATVQAAIGSIALDLAIALKMSGTIIQYGREVLTVAVLSILFTAPLGALAIATLAPVLLTKANLSNEESETDGNTSTSIGNSSVACITPIGNSSVACITPIGNSSVACITPIVDSSITKPEDDAG